ncbi:hypothetical protein BDN67DRAFT_966332 [Paxillus ammoniavirescens]|nr:hypothetical protein BDN67DRAFT_966332 [Paxillus ammoniavirescens]
MNDMIIQCESEHASSMLHGSYERNMPRPVDHPSSSSRSRVFRYLWVGLLHLHKPTACRIPSVTFITSFDMLPIEQRSNIFSARKVSDDRPSQLAMRARELFAVPSNLGTGVRKVSQEGGWVTRMAQGMKLGRQPVSEEVASLMMEGRMSRKDAETVAGIIRRAEEKAGIPK